MCGIPENKKIKWYLAMFAVILIADIMVIGAGYRSYREETVRIAGVVNEEITGSLTFEEAEKVLEDYGYNTDGTWTMHDGFVRLCITAAVSSAVLFFAAAAVIKGVEKESGRKYKKVLDDARKDIEAAAEGMYIPSDNESFSDISGNIIDNCAAELKGAVDRLYGNMCLTRESAEQDRNETKNVVTDISHQLKTPVSAIESTFEILQAKDLTDNERDEFEKQMAIQLASLEKLVSTLVNVSRLESGMINIALSEGKLFDTILDAVNGVWIRADRKNITIEYDDNSSLNMLEVMQDRKWLSEAFINILDNAVKYSEEHTVIRISVYDMSYMARIEFKDQGMGIPSAEKYKVFQRFYRGSSADVSGEEGSGVGLYLARRIISQHGGTVMVKDNVSDGVKRGCVFVVQIPLIRK